MNESYYYPLFEKIAELTGKSLLDTELQEIIDVIISIKGRNEMKITEDGIKELGFEQVVFGTYEYIISNSYAGTLSLHTNLRHSENPYVSLYLEHTFSDNPSPITIANYNNIEKLRVLIEALKGDE